MTRRRVLIVNTVVVVLVVGSLSCIALDREYWPLSQYPMFAEVHQEGSFLALRLYGVTQQKPRREIPLLVPGQIEPFDRSRLAAALRAIHSETRHGSNPQARSEALLDCLTRYEKLRLAGRHDGPPLRAVRLYRVRWLDDLGQETGDRPDQMRLVETVRR